MLLRLEVPDAAADDSLVKPVVDPEADDEPGARPDDGLLEIGVGAGGGLRPAAGRLDAPPLARARAAAASAALELGRDENGELLLVVDDMDPAAGDEPGREGAWEGRDGTTDRALVADGADDVAPSASGVGRDVEGDDEGRRLPVLPVPFDDPLDDAFAPAAGRAGVGEAAGTEAGVGGAASSAREAVSARWTEGLTPAGLFSATTSSLRSSVSTFVDASVVTGAAPPPESRRDVPSACLPGSELTSHLHVGRY